MSISPDLIHLRNDIASSSDMLSNINACVKTSEVYLTTDEHKSEL